MSPTTETHLKVLRRIEADGAYANLVLGPALAATDLSDADRRFVTDLVYGTLAVDPVAACHECAALLPEAVSYPAHNFRNLFELPVIFYALCLYLHVTGTATAADLTAAWLFVGFRALHSLIHSTVNIVMGRFLAYLAATLALWFMLVRAMLGAF